MNTRAIRLFAFVSVGLLALAGCRPSAAPASETTADSPGSSAADFVQIDSETTPAQRTYLEFGREVMNVLAARDYPGFHERLSSHARSRMSLNQFDPANDEALFDAHEKAPRRQVALPEFQELCARMEKRFGAPVRPLDLHVQSTEAHILAGQPKEEFDRLDILFAIGNIPPEVPVSSRRAGLRGQLAVKLSAAQIAEAAKAMETTPAELEADADFKPYLNVKLVIVEEQSRLRVGYFEFLPPSMLD